ncbi:hypothetical protein [Hydrogenimonas cancrithermarum]|uniref:Lipoprotein n=1 Tax=Hydrogenimonas cancrithermarum TaxID=2993563 RepID=A0ABM8FKL0_9BACT|nr:hypothetical protein [Hydrogenimonas cancrithermarum]BDY12846.1 hypothetical protein HCR_11580 [Hydrogenimonas cancrithermarum]BDY12963.1 hypothetical protein HCR_12750 [Hydrogenimonas cancrithermarum]
MKALALLLTLAGWLFACPPMPDTLAIELNRAGVTLKTPPAEEVERLRKRAGARRLEIGKSQENIAQIVLVAPPPERVVTKVGSQVDLSRFFERKECMGSWDVFHACQLPPESGDAKLVRKIDEAFVRKLTGEERCECSGEDRDLCPKGGGEAASVQEPDFLKWQLRWPAPKTLRIEANIGEPGGFGSLKEARASLHRINALLKKVVYGAHFPESRDEERSREDIYWTESHPKRIDYDFGKAVGTILETLENRGYLLGLSAKDREQIAHLAEGGKLLYYLPPRCAAKTKEWRWVPDGEGGYRRIVETPAPGWKARDNNARFFIDAEGCPRYELLR